MFKNLSEQEGGQQWTQHQVLVRRCTVKEKVDGCFPLGVVTFYRAYTSESAYEFHSIERIPSKTLLANQSAYRWQALPVDSPWCPSREDNRANLGLDFEGMWVLHDVPGGEHGADVPRAEFVAGAREKLDDILNDVRKTWGQDRPGRFPSFSSVRVPPLFLTASRR